VFFRGYVLLPGRLPVARGYLGSEDFLCLGNLTPYHTNGHVISCLGTLILSATTLATLLIIGGVEINLRPGVETEKDVCVMQWVR
jgi:hypothetical protein